MPEGHTLHRLAREHQRRFGGRPLRAGSPQGRFAAESIDGRVLRRAEAYGKHLLHRYSGGPILHVHLGLFGTFTAGEGVPPDPRGQVRLRLVGGEHWTDLRGPTACEILDGAQLKELLARLGPDPLRRDGSPEPAFRRIARSGQPVAALLMDQTVIAGVGNVYRAEVLFRQHIPPYLPGRELTAQQWQSMWDDLVVLMRHGVRTGRIETVRPADRPRRGILTRPEATYVYRHAGEPCRVCGTEISRADLAGRNLFWCSNCQAL